MSKLMTEEEKQNARKALAAQKAAIAPAEKTNEQLIKEAQAQKRAEAEAKIKAQIKAASDQAAAEATAEAKKLQEKLDLSKAKATLQLEAQKIALELDAANAKSAAVAADNRAKQVLLTAANEAKTAADVVVTKAQADYDTSRPGAGALVKVISLGFGKSYFNLLEEAKTAAAKAEIAKTAAEKVASESAKDLEIVVAEVAIAQAKHDHVTAKVQVVDAKFVLVDDASEANSKALFDAEAALKTTSGKISEAGQVFVASSALSAAKLVINESSDVASEHAAAAGNRASAYDSSQEIQPALAGASDELLTD